MKQLDVKLLLILVTFLQYYVEGVILCQRDGDDFCKFKISGDTTGVVDLTSVFSAGPLETKGGGNDYLYEACKGVACDGGICGNDVCIACQKTNKNYGIGDISTVSCNASQSEPSQNKWTIKLSYTGGTDSRKSDFTFMYSPKDTTPEMTFDSENPALDYHLTVIAKFGVPSGPSALSCTVVPGDPCKCTLSNGATGTIDLSPLFSNGPLTTVSGDYHYNYDCKGVLCTGEFGPCGGSGQCAACQEFIDSSFQYGLGAVSSLSYDVSGSNPDLNIWVVKVTYRDGNDGRSFDEAITYNSSTSSPSMTFAGESPSKFYHLDVTGKFGVPSGPSALSCTVVPGDSCKCTLSNGATGTIDLSPLFSNGPLTTVDGDYHYNYDCKGVPCTGEFGPCGGSGQCAACQVSTDGSYQYGLGAVSSLSYDVSGSNPDLNIWVVKVTYRDGKNDRSFDAAITYNASTSSPSMTFAGENPSKFYHLAVTGKFGVPSGPSALSCTVVPGDPCKCTLSNGATGTIDLSPLFSNGPLTTVGGDYHYTYDGCVGVTCEESCTNGTCAACQSESSRSYGLGALSTVEFNVSRSDSSREIWIVEAVYREGVNNRVTDVLVEYFPNMSEPKFTFQSESPVLQYNMAVFGTFLVPGGSGPGLECLQDVSSPCKCSLNDGSGSIDFSSVFLQGPLNVTFENYEYLYDACKGVDCKTPCDPSTQKCAACQDEVTRSDGYGLGTLSSVRFDVSKSEPSRDSWIVSLSYSGGASGRQFDVLFTHIPLTEKVDFQFIQENPSLSYHLAVYATFDVPGRD